jgi:hypothetical protein
VVLFEPTNPMIQPRYDVGCDLEAAREAVDEIYRAVAGHGRHPFMARANLDVPVADATAAELDAAWARPVVGFKDVSLHSCLPVIAERTDDIVFVVRDPVAVVVSALRRPSWWAWGWPASYHVMLANTVFSDRHRTPVLDQLVEPAQRARTVVERTAVLWTAANLQGLTDLAALGRRWWSYERLRDVPGEFEDLCARLGVPWSPTLARAGKPSATVSPDSARRALSVAETDAVLDIAHPVLEHL